MLMKRFGCGSWKQEIANIEFTYTISNGPQLKALDLFTCELIYLPSYMKKKKLIHLPLLIWFDARTSLADPPAAPAHLYLMVPSLLQEGFCTYDRRIPSMNYFKQNGCVLGVGTIHSWYHNCFRNRNIRSPKNQANSVSYTNDTNPTWN